jgi:hypothetical protein
MKVTVNNTTVTVNNKDLPSAGNVTLLQNTVEVVDDELRFVVVCNPGSREPKRQYACAYTMHGELLGYFTVN